jgi:hypothetical protein
MVSGFNLPLCIVFDHSNKELAVKFAVMDQERGNSTLRLKAKIVTAIEVCISGRFSMEEKEGEACISMVRDLLRW